MTLTYRSTAGRRLTVTEGDNNIYELSQSSGISFLQSGTGAIARTVQGKERDTLSVFDFMSTTEIADVQAGTKAVNVSTAIAAAITAADGKLLYIEPGDYLCTTGFTIPAGYTGSIFFKPQAKFWANANSITFFTAGSNWFGGQLHNPWLEGNGKTSVVGLDLSNFRSEGACIFHPVMQNMANGIIFRASCFDIPVDTPYMFNVTLPIQVITNCGGIQIRLPNIDTFGAIGIDVQDGATDNIGVQVIGGYVQGGTIGVKDAAYGTQVVGTYFEGNSDVDVSLVSGSLYFRGRDTQHFASTGAAAYKGRSADSAWIDNPVMGSSARSTGLFDFDNTNTNCRGTTIQGAGSQNTPLGTTTGIFLNAPQAFTPVVVGSGTAGAGTYTTQSGIYSVVGRTVHFSIALVWTAHTGTGNIGITGLPAAVAPTSFTPRRVFQCNIVTIAVTGPQLYSYFTGSGTELTIHQVDTAGSEALVGIAAAGEIYINGSYNLST